MKTIKILSKTSSLVRRKKGKRAFMQRLTALTVMLLYCMPAFAVEAQITTWGQTITTVMNALVAIYAVIGGFLVFVQYMQGSQEAQKNLIKFVIGLAVFGISALLATEFTPAP